MTLGPLVQSFERTGAAPADEVDRLVGWLATHPRLAALRVADVADVADIARRFSFHRRPPRELTRWARPSVGGGDLRKTGGTPPGRGGP